MTMRLAELLANNYGSNPELTNLVNRMETWLCPIYNPDGYVSGSRYNANGVDLNRDFPDRFTNPIDDPTGRQLETQAFMNFGYEHRFVMGANYHGGAQVLNYPYDAIADPLDPEYAPDDQLFYDFGIGYTSRNPDLWESMTFENGITRGWEWYMVYGGMQDWAYYYHGEHHVTIEISTNKSPAYTQMDLYWDHNREAMLWWMQRALTGMSGRVLDAGDHSPLEATLTLAGKAKPNTTLTDLQVGDYHRVISDGTYTLEASAACYQSQSADVSVITGTVSEHDFYLLPAPDFSGSSKQASVEQADPMEVVNYQIQIENSCPGGAVVITDTLPAAVTWTGDLEASQGTAEYEAGQIVWQGEVSSGEPVVITYSASLNECLPGGTTIENTTQLKDNTGDILTRSAQVKVNNSPPSLPSNPIPADGSTDQPLTTSLAWEASSDLNCDGLTYDIAFGSSSPPPIVAEGVSTASFDPGTLQPGTTYYWQVTATDGLTETAGPLWSFTTLGGMRHFFLPEINK